MRPQAQASTYTLNQIFPLNMLVYVSCANGGGAGELVLLSGDLHDLYHYTFNANSVTIEGHDNPQGLNGTGLTTGDKYQGTGVTQFEQTSSLNTLANEYTYVNNFRIIGQGPGNNYLVHYTYHFPFNANGELTSTVDNLSVECK